MMSTADRLSALALLATAVVVVGGAAPQVLWSQSTVWNSCNGASAPSGIW